MIRQDHVKAFLKTVEHFRYEHHIYDVFRDWTELAAAELHQAPYHAGLPKDEAFERDEAEYLAVAKKYQREDFDGFAKLLAITGMALSEGKQDFLGQCYMQLEISNTRAGQIFTPYEVSLLIARLTVGDPSPQIAEQGFITLHEPVCGSGGMVIAVAQVVEEAKHDPTTTLYFDAVDIDRQCASMTYIQTSLLGLTGVVRHGDTLRMEMRSHRFTPAARLYAARTRRMMTSVRRGKAQRIRGYRPPRESSEPSKTIATHNGSHNPSTSNGNIQTSSLTSRSKQHVSVTVRCIEAQPLVT